MSASDDGLLRDARGEPLTLYHGGETWDQPNAAGTGRGAIWLTVRVSVAFGFADQYTDHARREVKVFHARMRNPLDLTKPGDLARVYGAGEEPSPVELARDRQLIEQALRFAKIHGYDGLIHPDSDVYNRYMNDLSYAVFDGAQLTMAPPRGDEQQYNIHNIPVRGAGETPAAESQYPREKP